VNPHKYWRLVFTDNNGGDIVSVSDIVLSTHPHTLNLIANSVGFSGAMPANSHEKSFEFAAPITIGAYSFAAQGATAPKSWCLEFSDNGVNWSIAHIEHTQKLWQTGEVRYFVADLYSLNLAINGSNAAQSFNVFVHDLQGELITKKTVQNGNTEILMPNQNAVSVTAVQECGDAWQAGKYYESGALVIPTNPQSTPFYYRNRVGSISGLIEPTWLTNPEVFTHDSCCLWEVVERFNQPITQFPLIPTRKIS
jgi:hypothetical protein